MARPREKSDAGRIAATRRQGRGPAVDRAERPAPPARKGGKGGKGKKGRGGSPSAFARLLKLFMVIGFMGALGFGAVLVANVGLSVLGGMKFGEITFAELIDKVQDRVFDHDVPEARKKAPAPDTHKAAKRATRSSSSSSSSSSGAANVATPVVRAPMAAPSPDAYAKEAVARPDPEVEQARARLDQLLKGI